MNWRTGPQLPNDTQFDQIKLKFIRLIGLWKSNFDQLLTAFVHFNLNSRPNVSSDLLWLKRWIVEHINIHHHCEFQHHNPIRRRDIEFWKLQLSDWLNLDPTLIESIFIDSATSAASPAATLTRDVEGWREVKRRTANEEVARYAPASIKWMKLRPGRSSWSTQLATRSINFNSTNCPPKKKNIIEILHVGAYLSWYFDGYLKLSRTLKSAERT